MVVIITVIIIIIIIVELLPIVMDYFFFRFIFVHNINNIRNLSFESQIKFHFFNQPIIRTITLIELKKKKNNGNYCWFLFKLHHTRKININQSNIISLLNKWLI